MTFPCLQTALAALPAPKSAFESRLTLGPPPDDGTTLADLAQGGPALTRALRDIVAHVMGADAKLACACLIGTLSWEVSNLLAGLWLRGHAPAGIAPAALAFTPRFETWQDGADSGTSCVLDMTLDPSGVMPDGRRDAASLGQILQSLHAPLIDALAPLCKLGAAAQWRLVSDGLSGALLQQGKALGDPRPAIAIAQEILRDKALRLYAPQAEFVQLTLPADAQSDAARASDWFRLRGGCCRYYTTPGGDYCSTCVLRSRDDQITRLQDHLAGTLAA